jgi:hypothetical protein
MYVKSKFSVGRCCHKGEEIRETEDPQEYTAFRKENSLGDRDSRGIKGYA